MCWNKDGTLSSISNKLSSITRNIDGQIISKRKATHPYDITTTLNDSSNKVLAEGEMTFIYILEKLVGFIYHENRYYYQRNIQGDITYIYNEDGAIISRYIYDAYGRCKVLNSSLEEDTDASSIGNKNPFRYRGYYYDVILGLYFLQRRYYDPETGRFISPDSLSILDETRHQINGLNLYMYCKDNPIMFVDPSGHSALAIFYIGMFILAFTPIGGLALQVVVSIGSYAVMSIWALGAFMFNNGEGAWADMCSINWNPFNSNESATVNSNYVSFYKGVPVFRTELDRSGSFSAIFLKKGSNIDDLRHERGHNWQLMMMEIAVYGFTIGIPSPSQLGPYGDNPRTYYFSPWETLADILGGVEGRTHSEEIKRNAWGYFALTMLAFPFTFLYWLK